uniref:Uncharacterized protein n=1 Tax=Eutreptiella gymnastica TaxID=73025 RepID=A0A7S1IIR7_9EUGL
MEVKHTDTSKGLGTLKERFANIAPSLPYFDMLDELSSERRNEGILKLLEHLQAVATNDKDEVDGEHDVTEYTIKRLLRGCAKREGATRIGCSLAIGLLLKECPAIDPLAVISMSKKILVSASRYGDKDVAWGKAFVYAALVFSRRMMDRDNTEKIVTALLDIRKQSFVRQFVTQLLGLLVTRCSVPIVMSQIYNRLREGLKDPESYTPELLYLALKLQSVLKDQKKKEPSEDLKRLLDREFWQQDLLARMQPSLIETAFHFHPQVHVMWGAMLEAVFNCSSDPAEVGQSFKAFWKIMIDETIKDSTRTFHCMHVRNLVGKDAIVYIEAIEDETVRNELLLFLHRSWPNVVFDGLWGLIKTKKQPQQSVDSLIRQFWHLAELVPEDGGGGNQKDDEDSDLEEDSDDDDPLRATLHATKKFNNRPNQKKKKKSEPTGRGAKFSYFRTTVQRYIIHALKLHVAASPDCTEQVMEFAMNMGLFCVPETVARREVLRRNDLKWTITIELFDLLLSLLQNLAGHNPQHIWGAVRMLLDKEKAYAPRYDKLPTGNVVTEARSACVKQLQVFKGQLPKKLAKPGIHSAHQAYNQILGMTFLYLTVIQDEGFADLALDMCKYSEEHMQDLAGDMDMLIDLIIATLTYQADLKPKSYRAEHNFRLIQQAALSLFRKTCRHITMKGFGQILECLDDPMKVLVIDDPDAPAEDDDEEGEEDEDDDDGVQEIDEETFKKRQVEQAKAMEEDEGEDDEDEDEEDEEDEDAEGSVGEEDEEAADEDGDGDDGLEVDPEMDMDIDESSMAMILHAHQAVANKKKQAEQKRLQNEAIVRRVRLKMLDLVSVFISHCGTSGVIMDAGNILVKLMTTELRHVEGTRREQEKRRKKGRLNTLKNAELYSKIRCLVRDMISARPKPEEADDESYAKAAYEMLDHCTKIVKAQDIGSEGGVLKTDLFAAAVWTTGNLLKGGSSIKVDSARVTQCYREMFSSRHISMRLADLMEDMIKRYLDRFQGVFTTFIIPAMCQALVHRESDKHPHTKLVLLRSLNNVLHIVVPHSIYDAAAHLVLLKAINESLEKLATETLNEGATELVLEMAIICLKWDRKQTVQAAVQQLTANCKAESHITPRAKRALHKLDELLNKCQQFAVAKAHRQEEEKGTETKDPKTKSSDKNREEGKKEDKKKKKRKAEDPQDAKDAGAEERPKKKRKRDKEVEKKRKKEKKAKKAAAAGDAKPEAPQAEAKKAKKPQRKKKGKYPRGAPGDNTKPKKKKSSK